jgi:hypothetical protein
LGISMVKDEGKWDSALESDKSDKDNLDEMK